MAIDEPIQIAKQIIKIKPIDHDDEPEGSIEGKIVEDNIIPEEAPKLEVMTKTKVDEEIEPEVKIEVEAESEAKVEVVVETQVVEDRKDVIMNDNQNTAQIQENSIVFDKEAFKRQDTMEPLKHNNPSDIIVEIEADSPNPKKIDFLAQSQILIEVQNPENEENIEKEGDMEWKVETFVNGDKYEGYFSKGERNGKGKILY